MLIVRFHAEREKKWREAEKERGWEREREREIERERERSRKKRHIFSYSFICPILTQIGRGKLLVFVIGIQLKEITDIDYY